MLHSANATYKLNPKFSILNHKFPNLPSTSSSMLKICFTNFFNRPFKS